MVPLQNHRHEMFAQELAKGSSQSEAYLAAGYRGNRTAASRLSTNVNVQDRVAYLQQEAADQLVLTIGRLTKELEEARKLAISSKNASAAVSATMAKARLNGLLMQPSELAVSPPLEAPQESMRQVARRIAFILYQAERESERNNP